MNCNQYKILDLLDRENKPLFFREISKKSGVSIGGAQNVLKDYSSFLKKEISGRHVYYSINDGIQKKFIRRLIEAERGIRFIEKNGRLKSFLLRLIEMKIPSLIFGSFASFSDVSGSDLDLLVLGDKDLPEHLCPVDLHIVRSTKKEFEKSVRSGEDLATEIIKNHVIVFSDDYFLEVFD